MNCEQPPIETKYIAELPVDALESLPDELFGVRKVYDPESGNYSYAPVRVPTGKIFPWANMDNKLALEPNNAELEVPDRQILAGKMVTYNSTSMMETADASDRVDFLMLGKVSDRMVIQNTGFVVMPDGHDYILNTQYYAGEDGLPTTTSGGAKLFVPISSTVLAVNIVNN